MALNVGKNIKRIRKSIGMTQEELAERSNLSVNFVSRLEWSDTQNVSLNSLTKIAKALHASVADLVTSDNTFSRNSLISKVTFLLEDLDESQAAQLSKAFIQIIKAMQK